MPRKTVQLMFAPAVNDILPWLYGAFSDGNIFIRDYHVFGKFSRNSKTMAFWACPERRIEGKHARLHLFKRYAAVNARVML